MLSCYIYIWRCTFCFVIRSLRDMGPVPGARPSSPSTLARSALLMFRALEHLDSWAQAASEMQEEVDRACGPALRTGAYLERAEKSLNEFSRIKKKSDSVFSHRTVFGCFWPLDGQFCTAGRYRVLCGIEFFAQQGAIEFFAELVVPHGPQAVPRTLGALAWDAGRAARDAGRAPWDITVAAWACAPGPWARIPGC